MKPKVSPNPSDRRRRGMLDEVQWAGQPSPHQLVAAPWIRKENPLLSQSSITLFLSMKVRATQSNLTSHLFIFLSIYLFIYLFIHLFNAWCTHISGTWVPYGSVYCSSMGSKYMEYVGARHIYTYIHIFFISRRCVDSVCGCPLLLCGRWGG